MWIQRDQYQGFALYTLNPKERNKWPDRVKNASFSCSTFQGNYDNLVTPRYLAKTHPAKLTTTLNTPGITYRLVFEFYDEERLLEESTKALEKLHYGPPENMSHNRKQKITEISTLTKEIQDSSCVRSIHCQRKSNGPKVSDPHRPLEREEEKAILPYLEKLLAPFEGATLAPPFQDPEFYLNLVRQRKATI